MLDIRIHEPHKRYSILKTCVILVILCRMNDDDKAIQNETSLRKPDDLIELKHLPPILRKVAKYMLTSTDKSEPINSICKRLNLNYKTVLATMGRHKRKGIDFHDFIEQLSNNYLAVNLIRVDAAVVEGAVQGSAASARLFYQRTGRLREENHTNINISNTLALTYAVKLDESSSEITTPEKGKNDLVVYIPEKPEQS